MVAVSSRASFVQETSTTTGTGTYDLAGAVTGFQGFVAGNGDGAIVRYSVTDGTDWEVCEGTITDAATDTLSRGTVLESSNAGAAVNWGAGTKTISQVMTPGEVCGKFLIERITLGSAGEFDFNNIPGGYKRLIIGGSVRNDTGNDYQDLDIFLNADETKTNYRFQLAGGSNGTTSLSATGTDPLISLSAPANASAGQYANIQILIEDYSGANVKGALSTFAAPRSSTFMYVGQSYVRSSISAAITRVRIRSGNHPTNQLVGELTLYGEL